MAHLDPGLLHHPHSSPFDFTDKYLGQGRPFANTAFSANDLPYGTHRAPSSLTSGTSGVALPTNSNLDFNGNSLPTESPYHQSQTVLLSPPDSTTGSGSVSGNTSVSSNAYTTLPKPLPSNAYTADHFSTAPSIFSSWGGPSMTTVRPYRGGAPLSPPALLYPPNAIAPTMEAMKRFQQYPPSLPPQISPGPFSQPPRYPPNSYPPRTSGPFFSPTELSYHGSNMPQDNQSSAGRDGPPFHETRVYHHVLTLRTQGLVPEITASIQKGFFQVDQKWTCYRRNYFSVQCSFNFRNGLVEGPFYLNKNGSEMLIQQFTVSISAKTASTNNGESENRGLVQHTPKRDKATESVPGRHPIAPGPSHSMGTNGTYTSAGHLYPSANHIHSINMGGFGGYDTSSSNSPTISNQHTFERIQFQKATANNGKRRAQQQYFVVVVELSANMGRQGNEDWVIIATKESDPMVVRGRSPGHYKDNRRDSQASMDPDCGTGHGGGGHSNSLPTGSFGHGHSSVDWGSYRGQNGHFGGSSYRNTLDSRFSPTSMVLPNVLAEPPNDVELSLSDSRTTKSSCTVSSDRSALTPLSPASDDVMFSSLDRDTVCRKRPFEDDDEAEHIRFSLSGPFTGSISSLTDFSAMPYSKPLCASS